MKFLTMQKLGVPPQWFWVKKETLGTTGFGLFFLLSTGFLRYPFLTHCQMLFCFASVVYSCIFQQVYLTVDVQHVNWSRLSDVPLPKSRFPLDPTTFFGFPNKTITVFPLVIDFLE